MAILILFVPDADISELHNESCAFTMQATLELGILGDHQQF